MKLQANIFVTQNQLDHGNDSVQNIEQPEILDVAPKRQRIEASNDFDNLLGVSMIINMKQSLLD